MILYLVRHGQTDVNAEKRACGRIDASLNQLGIIQAEEMRSQIPAETDIIYRSSLVRTKQTADILNKDLGLPIRVADELLERDFGSLSGTFWSDWDPEMIQLDKDQKYDYSSFGGESAEDVKVRILYFIEQIKADTQYQKPLLVTSGGIIRFIYFLFGNNPLHHVPNGSIHKFEI